MRFFTREINPSSLGSCYVKGTEKSKLEVDSSVPLMHHDPKDLGLICLVKETQNSDSFGFKNPILDFLINALLFSFHVRLMVHQ